MPVPETGTGENHTYSRNKQFGREHVNGKQGLGDQYETDTYQKPIGQTVNQPYQPLPYMMRFSHTGCSIPVQRKISPGSESGFAGSGFEQLLAFGLLLKNILFLAFSSIPMVE